MRNSVRVCRPVAGIFGTSSVGCDKCLFPFCVVAEANITKIELREHMARVMQKLGNSVKEIASVLGTSTRSVYRYTSAYESTDCAWCGMIHSQTVMCKSDVYTVVCKGEQYIIILNKHRHVKEHELKVIEGFTEYVFPSSVLGKMNGVHDYWVLDKVKLEEARNFRCMCDALDTYTMSLGRSRRCLQT